MKNEISERMNEKRNNFQFRALFRAFTIFRPLSQFSGTFLSERAKTYSSTVTTYLKMAWGKRAALGNFVPLGRALFPSGIIQLCSNYYKDMNCSRRLETNGSKLSVPKKGETIVHKIDHKPTKNESFLSSFEIASLNITALDQKTAITTNHHILKLKLHPNYVNNE